MVKVLKKIWKRAMEGFPYKRELLSSDYFPR